MNGKVFCGLLGWLHPHEFPQYGVMKEFKPTGIKQMKWSVSFPSDETYCSLCKLPHTKFFKISPEVAEGLSMDLNMCAPCVHIIHESMKNTFEFRLSEGKK